MIDDSKGWGTFSTQGDADQFPSCLPLANVTLSSNGCSMSKLCLVTIYTVIFSFAKIDQMYLIHLNTRNNIETTTLYFILSAFSCKGTDLTCLDSRKEEVPVWR